MADKTIAGWYAANPITIDPGDIMPATENTGTTPVTGGFKLSQLMFNRYKIGVTVAANEITVAVQHEDGNNPSTDRPLYFKIGDNLRAVTGALSVSIPKATNWFNAGGAELGGQVVPYFVYVVWDSNSTAVALTISRKAHYRVVASGMSTTTNENHIYGYSGFVDGNNMVNIGYFEATLSLGGGYLWSVATFTTANLRSIPTFESQPVSWTPALSRLGGAYSNLPTLIYATYQVIGDRVYYGTTYTQHGTPGSSGYQTVTLPFLAVQNASGTGFQLTDAYALAIFVASATLAGLRLFKYDGTGEAVASKTYGAWGNYRIT